MERFVAPNNSLQGTIPDKLGSWTDLSGMFLHGNNLTGTIPAWLGQSEGLVSLTLQQNSLTGTVPSFEKAVGLELLNLGDNANLHGDIAPALQSNIGLKYLFAQGNKFSTTLTDRVFAKLKHLSTLDLSNNKLDGTIPGHFFQYCNVLSLHDNSISGKLPNWNADTAYKTTFFSAYANDLSGSIPPSIMSLVNLTYLGESGREKWLQIKPPASPHLFFCSVSLYAYMTWLVDLQIYRPMI
jgi:Leucine-rich repeat (LRR) protein